MLKSIDAHDMETGIRRIYRSLRRAAKIFGVDPHPIRYCLNTDNRLFNNRYKVTYSKDLSK